MQQKKRLLIIVPHLREGGAQKSAARLSELMADRFEVYIVTFFSEELFPTAYAYKGELTTINQGTSKSIFGKIRNTIERRRFLKRLKKEKNINVAVSYMHAAHTANILSKTNERTIISLRTLLSKNVKSRIEALTIRRLYRKADLVAAQNERARYDAVTNFNISQNKTTVIPNFYNFKTIEQNYNEPLPDNFPPTAAYQIFIQVGRLDKAKGQWHLLRIFKEVLVAFPQARLLIAGEGELRSFLKQYADKLRLKVQDLTENPDKTPDFEQHQVVLLGFIKNPYQYYPISDLFLFTSLYEGFPNALAEAMICALPVLSADCATGPRELIAPNESTLTDYPFVTDYGVLFPPFDSEIPNAKAAILAEEQLWITAIKKYLVQPELMTRKGKDAQERMKEFDKENVKKIWLNVMKQAQ